MKKNYALVLLSLIIVLGACKRKTLPDTGPDKVMGCTDPSAINYDSTANEDNGSCEYADAYFPMAAGNTWTLEDEITIPLVGSATVAAIFNMTKDTTINGMEYVISEETIGVPGLFDQAERYAYRQASNGKLYRGDLNAETFEEQVFIEYPATLGTTWPVGSALTAEFTTILNSITVPAGTFTDIIGIQYIEATTSTPTTIFWGVDAGPLKAEIDIEVPVLGSIGVSAELVSYTIK